MVLIVAMILLVYTPINTCQIGLFKHGKALYASYTSIKLLKRLVAGLYHYQDALLGIKYLIYASTRATDYYSGCCDVSPKVMNYK